MPGSERDRPPHQIVRAEVAAWLEGSAVTNITHHVTTSEAAQHIVSRGVSIGRSVGGAYGQGFYTATEPDLFFGDTIVSVAIRMLRPLIGPASDIEPLVDAIARRAHPQDRGLTPRGRQAVRRELLRLGYDGIVLRDGGGDGIDYVIAIEDATVKVVVDL